MVAVSDVQRRDASNSSDELGLRLVIRSPDRVSNTIVRFEVEEWPIRRDPRRHSGDVGTRPMGEEGETSLRVQCHHVARAIRFLVVARTLVFLDLAAIVFIQGEAARESSLHVIAVAETIEIERRLRLHHQRRALPQRTQILDGHAIDIGRVRAGRPRKLYLRTGHTEKTERIVRRQRSRLVSIDNVVRNRRDATGHFGYWTQGTERVKQRHDGYSTATFGGVESGVNVFGHYGATAGVGWVTRATRTAEEAKSRPTAMSRSDSNAAWYVGGIGLPGGRLRCTLVGLRNRPFLRTR